jgi:hypothetical protein
MDLRFAAHLPGMPVFHPVQILDSRPQILDSTPQILGSGRLSALLLSLPTLIEAPPATVGRWQAVSRLMAISGDKRATKIMRD